MHSGMGAKLFVASLAASARMHAELAQNEKRARSRLLQFWVSGFLYIGALNALNVSGFRKKTL